MGAADLLPCVPLALLRPSRAPHTHPGSRARILCAARYLHSSSPPCLPLSTLPSPRPRHVWYPEIAIIIKEIHLTQAVRLVGRSGQDRKTEPSRRSLRRVGITAMQAEFSANAARPRLGQAGVEGVLQVGMISMQHPLHFAIAQDG